MQTKTQSRMSYIIILQLSSYQLISFIITVKKVSVTKRNVLSTISKTEILGSILCVFIMNETDKPSLKVTSVILY